MCFNINNVKEFKTYAGALTLFATQTVFLLSMGATGKATVFQSVAFYPARKPRIDLVRKKAKIIKIDFSQKELLEDFNFYKAKL